MQTEQITKIKTTINLRHHTITRGHPFMIGFHGVHFALIPIAFIGLVVFGTRFISIITNLVVVPYRNHWHGGMYSLQIFIGTILGIAQAIASNGEQFFHWDDFALELCGLA